MGWGGEGCAERNIEKKRHSYIKYTVRIRVHWHANNLTCWVQAFYSHSWPATGNPEAPLSWTESPGVAHWPAGMEEERWTAPQLLDRQYYPVPDEEGCPLSGHRWLTGEQLLLPLGGQKREDVGLTPLKTVYAHVVFFSSHVTSKHIHTFKLDKGVSTAHCRGSGFTPLN